MFTFVLALIIISSNSIKIPLNKTLPSPQHSYQIHFDLNSSHTFIPIKSSTLLLPNLNLTFPMIKHQHSFVKIGLKYPSDFLVAVSQFYNVKESQIQLGFNPQPELIVSEVNFVQDRHTFFNDALYEFSITYNYGKGIRILNQTCEIMEGNVIYFHEYMIRQVLNSLPAGNGITHTEPQNGKIIVQGNLYNFPHIVLALGEMQIQLEVLANPASGKAILLYNNETSSSRIGIKTLKGYSKLQIVKGGFILKGNSFNIVLYIFLGLFVTFCLVLTINCRNETAYTMAFIGKIFKSVFLKDRRARVELLTTELE